jgi:hypothetical protein
LLYTWYLKCKLLPNSLTPTITMETLTTGQKVYIVPVRGKQLPFYGTIDKVGRKWFTVDGLHGRSFSVHDLTEKRSEFGWGYDYIIYLEKRIYDEMQQLIINKKELSELLKSISFEESVVLLDCFKNLQSVTINQTV